MGRNPSLELRYESVLNELKANDDPRTARVIELLIKRESSEEGTFEATLFGSQKREAMTMKANEKAIDVFHSKFIHWKEL